MYAAEGAGGYYILVVPSLDMVIAYQFDNKPQQKDTQAVLAATPKGIYDGTFGHLAGSSLMLLPQLTEGCPHGDKRSGGEGLGPSRFFCDEAVTAVCGVRPQGQADPVRRLSWGRFP